MVRLLGLAALFLAAALAGTAGGVIFAFAATFLPGFFISTKTRSVS
jgi:hypothetical protein